MTTQAYIIDTYRHECRALKTDGKPRACCVQSAIQAKELAAEYALTHHHPAVRRFHEECNALTQEEWQLVSAHKTKHTPRWAVCF